MTFDFEQVIENAIRDGIREGVKSNLSSQYKNPIENVVRAAIEERAPAIRKLLGDAIEGCMHDPRFREDLGASVRATLARTLVSRFGGELEKQVNVLKSDPTTRARIILAIEQIVKDCSIV